MREQRNCGYPISREFENAHSGNQYQVIGIIGKKNKSLSGKMVQFINFQQLKVGLSLRLNY